MVTRIDLRVHASAPSSRADDHKSLAQADAYGTFLPGSRLLLSSSNAPSLAVASNPTAPRPPDEHDDVTIDDISMLPPPSAARSRMATSITWDPSTFLDDTQLGYSALESQLVTSSRRVAKTPRKRLHRVISTSITPTVYPKATPPESHHQIAPSNAPQRAADQSELTETPSSDRVRKRARLDEDSAHVSSPEQTGKRSPNTGSNDISGPRTLSQKKPGERDMTSPWNADQSSYLVTPVLDRPNKGTGCASTTPNAGTSRRSLRPSVIASRHDNASGSSSNSENQQFTASKRVSQTHDSLAILSHASFSGNDTTSELPTSYSLSNVTSGSSKSKHSSVQRTVSDLGPLAPDSDKHVYIEQLSPNVVRNQVESRRDTHLTLDAAQPKPPVVVIKAFARIKRKGTTASVPPAADVDEVPLASPATFCPPSPKVGISNFETQVTPTLKGAVETPVAVCWKPVLTTRELRPTERGHWLLDISAWPTDAQTTFDGNLEYMISTGRLGWGVWCARGLDGLRPGIVKVYCWGEVVKHMFVVFYTLSSSHVRKLGAQWIDAEGKVVVQMRRADEDSDLVTQHT